MGTRLVAAWILIGVAGLGQDLQKGYVSPKLCQPCHAGIYASYAQTGMGRSFAPIESVPLVEDWNANFTHKASKRIFSVFRRDGGFYMRRTAASGGETVEKQIHYVIGSGNHSRTYLTRKKNGKLVELPLSWYSENGGYWAMSPGYDRPDHSDFRREVPDSCLFCHNGYPSEANSGIAGGIDCQRCHGPGEEHALRRGKIMNPAKLNIERQEEVCLQCHLESASRSIPDSIRRLDRGQFSYRPGEALGDFTIYFDRDLPGAQDSITVNHSAYGLRLSQCFLKSQGKLLCTTCHNPHHSLRVAAAAKHFTTACQSCHAGVHPERGECAGCHMPKRRSDDAVHVVITDHWIRRSPPPVDLKPKTEIHGRYSGPVKLLYPAKLNDPLARVYLALGALTDKRQLRQAALNLETELSQARPWQAGFYIQLANAFRQVGMPGKARQYYGEALRRKPEDVEGVSALAEMLLADGDAAGAIRILERAGARTSADPTLLNGLAVAYGRTSRFEDAEQLLRNALKEDEDLPLTWLNLGVCLQARNRNAEAAEAYRQALRLQPDFQTARQYLDQTQK
jgi:Tfp pilus assembly protein PilF